MSQKRIMPGILLMVCLMFFVWCFWDSAATLATGKDPDVVLNVSGSGSRGGAIFGGGIWVPGVTRAGTLRICNNHSQRIRVDSLGLSMKLERLKDGGFETVTDRNLFESFARNMKLTVKKGRLLAFSDIIFNGSFYEMLYESGSDTYRGYELSAPERFNINKDDYADLEYTVCMDEKAGNDMQGLKATVAFLVNMAENAEPEGRDNDRDRAEEKIVEEPGEEYPDISDHWAHDCIVTLLKHGIIQGYPDSTIRPENHITRAEAAVLVGKALKLQDEQDAELLYRDHIPAWAKGYVASTTKKGIFEGYPDGNFKPEGYISREEMTAVFMRSFDRKDIGNTVLGFNDKDDIAPWAVEYIGAAVSNHIVLGYPDNTFLPKNNVTRAEAFTMICRLLGYHAEHTK